MIHNQAITCPHCSSSDLKKHGQSRNGTQRWRCNSCKRGFQLSCTYTGHKPGIKAQIDAQILNGSGVRDTARILKINPGTVCDHLKKKTPAEVNPNLVKKQEAGQLTEVEVYLAT